MFAEAASFPLNLYPKSASRLGGMGLLGNVAARFIHLWEGKMCTWRSLTDGSAVSYLPLSMNLQVLLELGVLFEILPGGRDSGPFSRAPR